MPSSEKSLVIVAGAGASQEASLPIGAELKHLIARALDLPVDSYQRVICDDIIVQALLDICTSPAGGPGELHLYEQTCRMIRDAMPQAASIDNFIDQHRDNHKVAECGKLAIARCILEAESKSLMWIDKGNICNKMKFDKLESTWYNKFFQLIVDGCQLDDLPKRLECIAIITFNYDRCIEHYLHASFQNYYGINVKKSTELLSYLKIYHPYGWLGPLPWSSESNPVEFGAAAEPIQLINIAKQIKTFTEGTDETHSDIVEIRATIGEAKCVAFLGFAYNRQNLKLLFTGSPSKALHLYYGRPFYGTAIGLSESDIKVIKTEFTEMLGHSLTNVQLRRELTCVGLFKDYGRSLAIH